MKRFLIWLGLVGASLLASFDLAHAVIFTTSFPITGTAVNSTNVFGAGSSGMTGFDKTTGAPQFYLGNPGQTVDAGQYDDASTIFLDSTGMLYKKGNDGDPVGNNGYVVGGDTFGVSGALTIGGSKYVILAGTASGVRALNLSDGSFTALPGSFDFTDCTGLDAFLLPGGYRLEHIAIGLIREWPQLDIYDARGNLISGFPPDMLLASGTIRDVSFDIREGRIWYGTDGNNLFDNLQDFSPFAVADPNVSLSLSNRQAIVT